MKCELCDKEYGVHDAQIVINIWIESATCDLGHKHADITYLTFCSMKCARDWMNSQVKDETRIAKVCKEAEKKNFLTKNDRM